ncbi:MAG: reprolysin-like metallopeptidase [Steroidobacteraceae bacterium]
MLESVGRHGGLARRAAVLLLLLLTATGAIAANGVDDFRILYAESFPAAAAASTAAGTSLKASDDPLLGGLSFDAYGRRFNLALERNARVMQHAGSEGTAYLGTLSQLPASWVRLTRTGDDFHGLIWDGSDLYVVEPTREAEAFMVAPPATTPGTHVIYRLSDTLVDLGTGYCSALDDASSDPAATGLTTFKSMTTELKSQLVLQQAAGATRALSLSALGDASFLARYTSASAARDAVLVRLNNVDGIFSGQVGVEIRISSVDLYDGASDPFTATTVPGSLLTEVGRVRNGSATLKADGLTHLFTGRDLDGNTVGIAYINALCSRSFGVGLTESRGRGTVLESLIAAHEIGHNFGAVHDGSGECAATPPDQFIMAPQSSLANDTFSQCSVGTMSRSIAAAACVGTIPPPDMSVTFDQPPAGLTQQQSFTWSLSLTNVGGQETPAANLAVTVPTDIRVESASVPGGTCTLGAGSVQCSLGAVDAGASRTVALNLRALNSGTFALTAVGTAANDGNAANNSATASLSVDAAVPVVTPTPAPTGVAQSGGGGGGGGGGLGRIRFNVTNSCNIGPQVTLTPAPISNRPDAGCP